MMSFKLDTPVKRLLFVLAAPTVSALVLMGLGYLINHFLGLAFFSSKMGIYQSINFLVTGACGLVCGILVTFSLFLICWQSGRYIRGLWSYIWHGPSNDKEAGDDE